MRPSGFATDPSTVGLGLMGFRENQKMIDEKTIRGAEMSTAWSTRSRFPEEPDDDSSSPGSVSSSIEIFALARETFSKRRTPLHPYRTAGLDHATPCRR